MRNDHNIEFQPSLALCSTVCSYSLPRQSGLALHPADRLRSPRKSVPGGPEISQNQSRPLPAYPKSGTTRRKRRPRPTSLWSWCANHQAQPKCSVLNRCDLFLV